ncbi:MAG: mechanosensitive ion channel family protein [Clostridia bacterium]
MNINEILEMPLVRQVILPIVQILVILLAVILLRLALRRYMERKLAVLKQADSRLMVIKYMVNGLVYFLAGVAILASIPGFRDYAGAIFAGSGILALIIGFASQETFSNIISGFFIIVFKPFRVGDRISFIDKNCIGIVEDITFRHTVIRTFENKRIIVPNSMANKEMIENANLVEEKVCSLIDFDISYDSDVDKAMAIIREEVEGHVHFLDNRTDEEKKTSVPAVPVRLIGFEDSAVRLRAWAWSVSPLNGFLLKCDVNKSIKERFDREGVEIPYPHRTLVYKKDMENR